MGGEAPCLAEPTIDLFTRQCNNDTTWQHSHSTVILYNTKVLVERRPVMPPRRSFWVMTVLVLRAYTFARRTSMSSLILKKEDIGREGLSL
jgi:hypothetical protein